MLENMMPKYSLSSPTADLHCLCPCRRFQPVKVPEPSVEETYQILLGLRERYEAHHKLTYTDEALQAASKFSSQYISDRFLPDKVSHADVKQVLLTSLKLQL